MGCDVDVGGGLELFLTQSVLLGEGRGVCPMRALDTYAVTIGGGRDHRLDLRLPVRSDGRAPSSAVPVVGASLCRVRRRQASGQ